MLCLIMLFVEIKPLNFRMYTNGIICYAFAMDDEIKYFTEKKSDLFWFRDKKF